MTTEQRNDLCLEWEQTCILTRQRLQDEYRQMHRKAREYTDWEEFIVDRLGLRRFWQSVGLI